MAGCSTSLPVPSIRGILRCIIRPIPPRSLLLLRQFFLAHRLFPLPVSRPLSAQLSIVLVPLSGTVIDELLLHGLDLYRQRIAKAHLAGDVLLVFASGL